MKKLFFSLFLLLSASIMIAQINEPYYTLTFDSPFGMEHLRIDTVGNSNNIWQIGMPYKQHITSAFTVPNAIVTDLIHPYPTNDTSSFIITNIANQGYTCPHTVALSGRYNVYSDTLSDYGKIEFSPNNGLTWFNLIKDTLILDTSNYFDWNWDVYGNPHPTLSGNSFGWKDFYVNLAQFGNYLGVTVGDTVLFRFTFISDSIETNKDGLAFDNLQFMDICEGIAEFQNDNLIAISPNPTSEKFTITCPNEPLMQLCVYDMIGKEILRKEIGSAAVIDVSALPAGVYLITVLGSNWIAQKKLIKQ